jgi:hypothetical protein
MKNQTIMNMVRSILSGKHIPKTFWPEAVNWTVHILNRSPTFAVRSKTPEEAWNVIKPSVSHFRVFGCISHVHVPDNRRVKLDNKSHKCIFFGVSDESKVYRLFDPISHKIIVSRDVVFEEDQSWDWEVCYKEAIVADLVWETDEGEATNVGDNEEESEANSTEESEGSEEIDHGVVQEMDHGVAVQDKEMLSTTMFVSRKVVSGKLFSKLFYVCLLLGKLVNGKHFPVKKKFGLVSRKVFSLLAVFVFWKVVSGKSLSKLSCVCLPLEKLVNGKHFPVKGKFGLVFRNVFSWKIWAENTFRKL